MKPSDMFEVVLKYEQGMSLSEVARLFEIPRTTLAKRFEAMGIELRQNGHAGLMENLAAIPPRLCTCGRLAMQHDWICFDCRRHPPCRCPPQTHGTRRKGQRLPSGTFYLGHEYCRACNCLMERAG